MENKNTGSKKFSARFLLKAAAAALLIAAVPFMLSGCSDDEETSSAESSQTASVSSAASGTSETSASDAQSSAASSGTSTAGGKKESGTASAKDGSKSSASAGSSGTAAKSSPSEKSSSAYDPVLDHEYKPRVTSDYPDTQASSKPAAKSSAPASSAASPSANESIFIPSDITVGSNGEIILPFVPYSENGQGTSSAQTAAGSDTNPRASDNTSLDENETPILSIEEYPEESSVYSDGEHTGKYTLTSGSKAVFTVKLTLKDDKITDITASAEGISDDDVQNALKAIEEKLKAKSGEQLGSIDDLSDGSEASKGIIEAVKQALKDAKA